MLTRYAIGAAAVVVLLAATYHAGYSAGQDQRDASAAVVRDVAASKAAERVRYVWANDAQLAQEQRIKVEIQRVEVIKYVTKYRDIIKERPVIVECVNDSGLLQLLNATLPTVPADNAVGGSDGRTATDAPVH